MPNDPRGELRWCLSKLRNVLDEPGRQRVETAGDTVAFHLDGCFVDAIEIASAAEQGIGTLDGKRLRELAKLFAGDFLDGLEIDRAPFFNNWLTAQRRRFRACHAAVLEHLVGDLAARPDETLPYVEKWIELTPFDERAHTALLTTMAHRGQFKECEEHIAAASRLFASEDLDFSPVREAWRAIRNGRQNAAPPELLAASRGACQWKSALPEPKVLRPAALRLPSCPLPKRAKAVSGAGWPMA